MQCQSYRSYTAFALKLYHSYTFYRPVRFYVTSIFLYCSDFVKYIYRNEIIISKDIEELEFEDNNQYYVYG